MPLLTCLSPDPKHRPNIHSAPFPLLNSLSLFHNLNRLIPRLNQHLIDGNMLGLL